MSTCGALLLLPAPVFHLGLNAIHAALLPASGKLPPTCSIAAAAALPTVAGGSARSCTEGGMNRGMTVSFDALSSALSAASHRMPSTAAHSCSLSTVPTCSVAAAATLPAVASHGAWACAQIGGRGRASERN